MLQTKRHTQVDDRYQINCTVCGFLQSARSFNLAVKSARLLKQRHAELDEKVTIYDTMAHVMAPESFDAEGNILTLRGRVS